MCYGLQEQGASGWSHNKYLKVAKLLHTETLVCTLQILVAEVFFRNMQLGPKGQYAAGKCKCTFVTFCWPIKRHLKANMNHKVCISCSVPEQTEVIQGQPNWALAAFLPPPMAGHGDDAMASPSEPSGWHLHRAGKQEGSVDVFTEHIEMERDWRCFFPPASNFHLTIFYFTFFYSMY